MWRVGRDCPKCSKPDKPISMQRRHVEGGTEIQLDDGKKFKLNGLTEMDRCARCRGHYPVELNLIRL